MALTMRYIAGERPGTGGWGNEGLVATGFDRETTIIAPGGYSLASYGRNLDTAEETATLTPTDAIADGPALNASKIGWTFWLHNSNWTPDETVFFTTIIPSGGAPTYSHIALQTSGAMSVAAGADGSAGASTGAVFTDNAASYFMATVEWNGTTSYRWRLWVWGGNTPSGNAFSSAGWGSPLIDFTETNASITAGINRVVFRLTAKTKGVAPNTHAYMDDMTMWEFASDADLPTAPFTVFAATPDGAGAGVSTDNGFTGGTGTNPAAADVDDLDADDDTTYDESVLTTTATERQTYTLTALPTLPAGATISGVSWFADAKSSSASAAVCRIIGYVNSTLYDSGTNWLVVTANYESAQYCMTLSPNTSAAWTETEVNGMECGMREGGLSNRTVRLTQTFANVAVMPAHRSLVYPSRAAVRASMTR